MAKKKKEEKEEKKPEEQKPAEAKKDHPQFISIERLRKVAEEKRKEIKERESEINKEALRNWVEARVKHIKEQAVKISEEGYIALFTPLGSFRNRHPLFALTQVLSDIGFRVYTLSIKGRECILLVAWDE